MCVHNSCTNIYTFKVSLTHTQKWLQKAKTPTKGPLDEDRTDTEDQPKPKLVVREVTREERAYAPRE